MMTVMVTNVLSPQENDIEPLPLPEMDFSDESSTQNNYSGLGETDPANDGPLSLPEWDWSRR